MDDNPSNLYRESNFIVENDLDKIFFDFDCAQSDRKSLELTLLIHHNRTLQCYFNLKYFEIQSINTKKYRLTFLLVFPMR